MREYIIKMEREINAMKIEDGQLGELKSMKIELEWLADRDYELRDESIKLYCDIGKFLDKNGDRLDDLYDRYNEIMLKHDEKDDNYGRKKYL